MRFPLPSHSRLTESQRASVFVDIQPWLANCEHFNRIVMEGVYRHAHRLCIEYTPVYFLTAHEKDFKPGTLAQLSLFLGKPIKCFRRLSDIADANCKVWLSLAVDFCAPLIHTHAPFKKLAILHDVLAGKGVFGASKQQAFRYGARYNDAFAYVSSTSNSRFMRYSTVHAGIAERAEFVPYSCFHEQQTILTQQDSVYRFNGMLSVHSGFRRKNLEKEVALSLFLNRPLFNVGQNFEYTPEELLSFRSVGAQLLGPISDEALQALYLTQEVFTCLSSEEGFSIPPLEALISGVPTVLLSDIPEHREIYEPYGACFLSILDNFSPKLLESLPKVPEALKIAAFDRYSSKRAIYMLEDYLSTQV